MAEGVVRERGPVVDSVTKKAAPTQQQPDIWTQAQQQYPIIQSLGLQYKMNPQPNRGFLEFWPGQEIGTPDRPRPKEFPIGTAGLEVYDPTTRPIDILGDIVSHHLIDNDPVIKNYYSSFEKSLTPQQQARLTQQYLYAKNDPHEPERRPYPEWYRMSGLPAYFRGYAFNQWDRPEEMYTLQQMQQFDQMMNYLKQPLKKKAK